MRRSNSGTELASLERDPCGVGDEACADFRVGFPFTSFAAGALEHDGFVLPDAVGTRRYFALANTVARAFLRVVSAGISFVWRE